MIPLPPSVFVKFCETEGLCLQCAQPGRDFGPFCRPSCYVEHCAARERALKTREKLLQHYGSEEAMWDAVIAARAAAT